MVEMLLGAAIMLLGILVGAAIGDLNKKPKEE
jgi:hypothetical protein